MSSVSAPPLVRLARAVREQIDLILARVEMLTANTNRDVLPASLWRSDVVPAMAAAGVTSARCSRQLGGSYCGSTLYKSNIWPRSAARVAGIVRSEPLGCAGRVDVYWDPISSIEPNGRGRSTTSPSRARTTSSPNDIIVHNSIEQDADVVMFIYRDEYYNSESADKGIAELIVAKHRSGATDSERLAFRQKYTLFSDLARGEA